MSHNKTFQGRGEEAPAFSNLQHLLPFLWLSKKPPENQFGPRNGCHFDTHLGTQVYKVGELLALLKRDVEGDYI
jgi:hypothetical protein